MCRILLIDDDSQINDVVRATLELLGHTVATVESADAAEQAFAAFNPDVTLVDYMLPGRSGLDLVTSLGETNPESIRCLATGIGDYSLLKDALGAGASSLLCKPYRMADMVDIIDNAILLETAIRSEHSSTEPVAETLRLVCAGDWRVSSDELASLVAFARHHGASPDVAARRLPLIACELMKNAATHGSPHRDQIYYEVEMADSAAGIVLTVSDNGPGFDSNRMLARSRVSMEKSRASGLQLVSILADELRFENGGRKARVRLSKRTTPTT